MIDSKAQKTDKNPNIEQKWPRHMLKLTTSFTLRLFRFFYNEKDISADGIKQQHGTLKLSM